MAVYIVNRGGDGHTMHYYTGSAQSAQIHYTVIGGIV